ncbi:hypothetical protein [Streptomyces sp. NPDC048577]|uniref:hypothetical protein n=1 Tax=Streptomyces sp. NPDC048577 TaxID=3157209 RepID=UPI003443FE77
MHATPLRRTLTALTATTLLAGGLLFVQTATAPTATAAGRKIVCHVDEMRRDAASPRTKANKLQRRGATSEARKARAQADALDRRVRGRIAADDNHKPWH